MKVLTGLLLGVLVGSAASESTEEFRFTSEPQTIQATVGQKVVLPCDYEVDKTSVDAAKQILRLWFFEKSVLFVDSTPLFKRDNFNVQGNNLEVMVTGPETVGEFSCRLSVAKEVVLTHHIQLLGPPTIDVDADVLQAKEGGTIYIHCRSNSVPQPTITYTKEGSNVDLSSFVKHGALQIGDATRNNAGVYVCTATNGYEPDAVKKITVNYVGRPDINVTVQWKNLQDKEKKSVEITCKFASEDNTTITWRKGGSEEVQDSEHYETSKEADVSILRIRQITKELFDNYTCIATNKIGETRGTVEISSVPIKPTISLVASDVKANVVVSTVSPYRVRLFQLTLKGKVGEPRVIEFPVPSNEIAGADGKYELRDLVSQLTPNSEYEGSVIAITEKEESSAPERFTFRTQSTVITSASDSVKIHSVIWLLIGFVMLRA
ncbi:hemicentin-1-like [Varroa destructor]|uniref:Ig-like domain-containing protein n=1 Tax=Varroa destructor TaxID=109461 RepID=A0A7M7KFN5_VARDE|nr:hemicentin-1-like [Varroa destructor]